MSPRGARSRPSAAIASLSFLESDIVLLGMLPSLRARVIAPQQSDARASPEEIHWSSVDMLLVMGENSSFIFSTSCFVKFQYVISDVAKEGGSVEGIGRTE